MLKTDIERWIPGYEGKYYATWYGQIFRVFKNGKKRELKGYAKGNLYCVKLSDGTEYQEMPFQRVVWMAFKGPIPDGHLVVRKTKIRTMNGMQNLKLRSKTQHGKKTGALAASKAVILMDEDGQLLDSWPSARKAAKDLFVSYQTVMDICNGKIKRKPIVNVRWARKNETY